MLVGALIAIRSGIWLFRLIHAIRKSKYDQEAPVNLEFDSLDHQYEHQEDPSKEES